MFDYDIASTSDEISGGTVAIDPSITFPLIKLDDTTPSKLRGMFLDWTNTGTGTLKATLTTQQTTTIANLTDPDDEGTTKLSSPLLALSASNFFKLKLSGIISRINAIRLDLRPMRKGVG